jgi:hypothetical protein
VSYSIWGRAKEQENREFSERLFRRAPLPAWDARWHALTVPARSAFLNEVKGPARKSEFSRNQDQPSVSVEKFDPWVLEGLTGAGFVEVRGDKIKKSAGRVYAVEGVRDFITRVRALQRYHLLDGDQPCVIEKYVNACYYMSDLLVVIQRVLRKAGLEDYLRIEEALKTYVVSRRWPGWVVQAGDDPLAERILDAIRQAERPPLLSELPGRVGGADADKVRSSLDRLIAHMVLFEDLDPRTLDLRVGLLPAVHDELIRESQPRRRPQLVVCPSPKEIGPDEGVVVSDLRAFLLEVASEPPRLRQDRSLFQKEVERFQDVLEPLPAWLSDLLGATTDGRLNQALAWANCLKLVKETAAGKQVHLHLAPKGQSWLTRSIDDQYDALYEVYRSRETPDGVYLHYGRIFGGVDTYDYYSSGDHRFLGATAAALKLSKGNRPRPLWEAKPQDFAALRDALHSVFAALPIGTFSRLDSLAAHVSYGEHNPLLLGNGPDQNRVAVYWKGRLVPHLEERREEVGRLLIEAFVRNRLIPLGCVRVAIDDQGQLCIAREPRLDAYFGRAVAPAAAAADLATTRVVVQPDFSIVIIGPNPAPAAELLPFCERTSRGPGRGALVLTINREAVVKAVAHGLKPSEIVARLKRHASHEVPTNVLREVVGWADWVRRVSLEPLTVIRCPDRDTADRVMAALRKQAERLQDTLLAIDPKKLTTVERQKLKEQGIIVDGIVGAETPAPKSRAKKRRRYYY